MGLFNKLGNSLVDYGKAVGPALATAINDQFGFGENSLNNGAEKVDYFGMLGDFADKIDKSAERSYIEDGLIRNIRPRMRDDLWQVPDMTIIIKKRMFSSLADNFRLDLLEDNEKLFYRASKRLFQNKCRSIASYERLFKFERFIEASGGVINPHLMPGILSAISDLQGMGINLFDENANAAINTIRQLYAFSEPSNVTTWVNDDSILFPGELGEGTGVIEFTMVSNFNSTISTRFGEGKLTFTLENPYNMMRITNEDIDRAISDGISYNPANKFSFHGNFGHLIEVETRNRIQGLKTELNSLRAGRGASAISFIESPNSLISKRLRVLVDERGEEVNFTYNPGLVGLGSSVDLDSNVGLGAHGLNSAEKNILKKIISDTFLLWGYENTTRTQMYEWNTETNYVRRKMRLHYAGKLIIQPMDIVNVFVTSHTEIDPKLTQGFESTENNQQLNIRQKINNLVANINNFGNIEASEAGQPLSSDDVERIAITGPDFPPWLWRMLRNDFTRQAAGTCVFVGLVDSAPRTFNSGKHTISVSCKDNSHYFSRSQINITPALDVWNGTVYDPLTPFNVSFDAATGEAKTNLQNGALPELLKENQILLNTGAIQFSSGRWRGMGVTESLFKANDMEYGNQKTRKVLTIPDGFVYRWKQGIEAITKTERVSPPSAVQTETSPRLTKSPFAGQDVMNVLSLLITGQPYNYNTFLKAALDNGNSVTKDILSNKNKSQSYIDGLITELVKRNSVWGNFVPFKKLVISDTAQQFILEGRADFITKNNALNELLRKKAELMDELQMKGTYEAQTAANQVPVPVYLAVISSSLEEINGKIARMQADFNSSIIGITTQKQKGQLKIINDDFSYDPLYGENSALTSERFKEDRAAFRKHINTLTQRRLWKVKANEDKNLFIVDDQYDKSFDIQAFERAINGQMSLLSSEYVNVDAEIKKVAHLLGLEVFSDSQGHIQVRPPQYNKVPSSVFFRMFKQRSRTGIKVFPEFLESLFYNQTQGLINAIEIAENNIRMRGIALGLISETNLSPDAKIKKFISPSFTFLSDPDTGKIGGDGLQKLFTQVNPDISLVSSELSPLQSTIQSNLSATRIFDAATRADLLDKVNFKAAMSQKANDNLYKIRSLLRIATGREQPTREQLFSDDKLKGNSSAGALKIINEIGNYVEERQGLLRSLSNSIKNLNEGVDVNQNNRGANSALFPQLHANDKIPEILEHMIEDETLHDFGPGSGGRYIIRDRNIISMTIEEKAPEYCAVTVDGKFDSGDQGIGGFVEPPANLQTDKNGGNAVSSAYAVDYDMWHMYGFNVGTTVPTPFFFNPDTQCAPYAAFLLNLARKQILQGTVELIGNEYYQAGDVVYIENEDLLFYVDSVSHNFNYGSNFTTTLQLKYGHTPGEYIPTMLDMVGKMLFNTRSTANQFRSSRFEAAGAARPMGALIIQTQYLAGADIFTVEQNLLHGSHGENNRKTLSNILFAANDSFSKFSNKKGHLELRVYTNSLSFSKTTGDLYAQPQANQSLVDAAQAAKQWFINPQKYAPASGSSSFLGAAQKAVELTTKPNSPESINGISGDNIKIKTIDISLDNLNSPSGTAWNIVRSLISNGQVSGDGKLEPQNMAKTLYNNVIDIWQVFEEVETALEEPGVGAQDSEHNKNIKEQIEEKKAKYK